MGQSWYQHTGVPVFVTEPFSGFEDKDVIYLNSLRSNDPVLLNGFPDVIEN